MAQRVTLRKRQPYNTTSNRRRVVKTPGGRLVYHHLKKIPTQPKCGDCGVGLPGVRLPLVPHFNLCTQKLLDYWVSALDVRIPWGLNVLGSCPPSSSVCNRLQTHKDCAESVWRLAMW